MHISRRRVYVLLVVLMLTAVFFRLWDLAGVPPGLYHDEAMNGNNALFATEGGLKVFYEENTGREGLYINILSGALALFGNEPWTIRFVSAIFGILTVLGLFFLTRELFRGLKGKNSYHEIIALAASFFLAVSFWHINFSRIGFRAIMAPFFLIWGLYFLWLIFRPNFSINRRSVAAGLGGIFFGLGFHSYIAYRIAPLLLIIPFIKLWKSNLHNKWRYAAIFLIAAFVIAVPLGLYYVENPEDFFGRTSQISIFNSESPAKEFASNFLRTFGMFWFGGDVNPRHNFPGAAELWWPIGILFAMGLITSLIKFKTGKYIYALLWLWLIGFSLPVAFSSEGIPHALRAILMLPPAMIFSALGFAWVLNFSQNWINRKQKLYPNALGQLTRIKKELFLLLVVFLAAHIVVTYNQYFIRWAKHPQTYFAFSGNYTEIGAWLNEQTAEIPKYVIVNAPGILVRPPDDAVSRKISMPAQTVMFVTNTWSLKERREKNIQYLRVDEIPMINCSSSCIVTMLEIDGTLREKIKEQIPGLTLNISSGFPVLKK